MVSKIIAAGNNIIPLCEFSSDPEDNALYTEEGLEVGYGYDAETIPSGTESNRNRTRLRVFYSGIDDNDEIAYAGIEHSAGLHNINLSRPLAAGERITLNWLNGQQLVIYEEDGKTKVKKPNGGSYSEIGKLTAYKNVMLYTAVKEPITANLDNYYEISGGRYVKTSDVEIVSGKTYYTYTDYGNVFELVDGVYTLTENPNVVGRRYYIAVDGAENSVLKFDDEMKTKRFDYIETRTFEEIR